MQTITFILNGHRFQLPSSRKILNKIPEGKEEIYSSLFNNHEYSINSSVRDEVFQSYLDNWQNDTDPQINSDNILEYYQLSQELGVFSDYILQPKYKPLLFSNLLSTDKDILFDRSGIERSISLHLDDYISKHESELFKIRITSLFNIFYHKHRYLEDHQKAYYFIIRISEKVDKNFYSLMESLDVDDFEDESEKLFSFIDKDKHLGFYPKNADKFLIRKYWSLEQKSDRICEDHDLLKEMFKSPHQNIKIFDTKEIGNQNHFDNKIEIDNKQYSKICVPFKYFECIENVHRIIQNIDKLSAHPHINILKIIGICFDENGPYFIKEYFERNLFWLIKKKKISNVEKVTIIYQIAEGLSHLNDLNIFIQALNPYKILLDSHQIVKISEYDYVFPTSNDPQMGYLDFLAPNSFDDYGSPKCDVFSFGNIVYFILTGGDNPSNNKFNDLKNIKINDFSYEFLRCCWEEDPEDRPTFGQILEQLKISHYGFFDLNESEIRKVEDFVKNHKKSIQESKK
ncbi:hypothetical protein M9Y10_035860 [Tritrichomonas musculus]|uniref:Protein kinase domain-containing protein n=1 Tax=Tritrichomonas musculus TaxID=1915356 RepID=A0ABR2GVG9_9EUKA